MVRAKFKVEQVIPVDNGATVVLRPVTQGSEENEKFFKFTPWGSIELGTVNNDAIAEFEIGKEVYVDFTPA
jgi:hypothetical protein